MINLARHAQTICSQIYYVAEHAISGCKSDDANTIAAMGRIIVTLHECATAIGQEKVRREGCVRDRIERDYLLRRARE